MSGHTGARSLCSELPVTLQADCSEGGIIHLINSGAASLDFTGQQLRSGKPTVKPFWEITAAEKERCLKATTWYPARLDSFRGGGYSSGFLTRGDLPLTMSRLN